MVLNATVCMEVEEGDRGLVQGPTPPLGKPQETYVSITINPLRFEPDTSRI
jgi:hypothetical protein